MAAHSVRKVLLEQHTVRKEKGHQKDSGENKDDKCVRLKWQVKPGNNGRKEMRTNT